MFVRYLVILGSVILALAAFVQGETDIFQFDKKDHPRKFCGRHLADTLSLICDGTYNDLISKKSGNLDTEDEYVFEQQLDQPSFPFRSRAAASRLIPGSFRRYTRGVYDECCRKSCSISEMQSYCGNHRSLFKQ